MKTTESFSVIEIILLEECEEKKKKVLDFIMRSLNNADEDWDVSSLVRVRYKEGTK